MAKHDEQAVAVLSYCEPGFEALLERPFCVIFFSTNDARSFSSIGLNNPGANNNCILTSERNTVIRERESPKTVIIDYINQRLRPSFAN